MSSAALTRHVSASWIAFDELTSPVLEKFAAVMQDLFPELMGLHLQSFDEMGPIVPIVSVIGWELLVLLQDMMVI